MISICLILSFSINEDLVFFNKHLLYSTSAIILMIIISSVDIKSLRRLSLIGLIIFTILLFSVLLLDYEIKGSKRWIKISAISIQPSEFIKPFFLILSSWFLCKGIEGKKIYLNILFFSFFLLVGLIILLLLVVPHTDIPIFSLIYPRLQI